MGSDLFAAAVDAFARANSEDPSTTVDEAGETRPREVVRAERLVRWVERLSPDASTALRLAAHCQHLKRWAIPRTDYPEGRTGYLKWRKDLSRFHADEAERILTEIGFDATTMGRVRAINQKRGLKQDPDVQTMEDALCLAFMEDELEPFISKHPERKVIEILRKTWAKMSGVGQREALALPLSKRAQALVETALAPPSA